jgi:RimJ/RimL family protein N-acetyltransferase
MMSNFIVPWARGHGLAKQLVVAVEDAARAAGYTILNLDVRDTQTAAIQLYESLGYTRWGTHPCYARVDDLVVPGHFYFKRLTQHGEAGG